MENDNKLGQLLASAIKHKFDKVFSQMSRSEDLSKLIDKDAGDMLSTSQDKFKKAAGPPGSRRRVEKVFKDENHDTHQSAQPSRKLRSKDLPENEDSPPTKAPKRARDSSSESPVARKPLNKRGVAGPKQSDSPKHVEEEKKVAAPEAPLQN